MIVLYLTLSHELRDLCMVVRALVEKRLSTTALPVTKDPKSSRKRVLRPEEAVAEDGATNDFCDWKSFRLQNLKFEVLDALLFQILR